MFHKLVTAGNNNFKILNYFKKQVIRMNDKVLLNFIIFPGWCKAFCFVFLDCNTLKQDKYGETNTACNWESYRWFILILLL